MTDENKVMFISAIIGAGVTSTAIMIVFGRLQYKKARRIRFENELSWLQMIRDDLRDGKMANFPPEFIARLLSIITPLIDEGLIK